MEPTGEIANNKKNTVLHYIRKILSMFDTSPVGSIWLEMSINWHTKGQGLKKNVFIFLGEDQPLARPHYLYLG